MQSGPEGARDSSSATGNSGAPEDTYSDPVQEEVKTVLVMPAQALEKGSTPHDLDGEERRRDAPVHHVLVVDDNRDSADSLAEILRILGYEVTVAYSGEEALQHARSFPPDAVLCDIRMPGGMDGYDVARTFRAEQQLQGSQLVAVTGYGQQEDRRRALAAGFDEHVTKPVELSHLRALLEQGH
jgi:CheY-like chemotaxis protein